ncbi:bifunctional (p)ppGpp synthetase/guanosine-3',5'-bis(diphosphate) 3'-pyrophosphohydrolase [Sporolactobacillus sp. THM19-2]|uniref:RelA/SpoT family protein n=1 Tax=Sporolactobacillus sp. THM19-2 TaxID=2511171 RepID=UPI001021018A|nr:bifunctional (p)ppGpp synthetase/guanosine-3',5'-bis(diphosphate) 3'-pyrophosphohydrolase [Sporolactobacillus sp. THM19-2]RYL94714.1 bifunctional (p)ppGpp synthetase/guanosine-3',5'-bis(diphosphate) 3'-pyrophosphohydrolase [Sporolactobacillus sp. THM19-2]
MTMDELIQKASTYLDKDEIKQLNETYEFAKAAHKGQVRKSGEPYITHPVEVAGILVELKMDVTTIISGFLHDVVEDTPITLEDIRNKFGDNVATLVDGVTKLRHFEYTSKEDQQAENHRKMFVAMARDLRCVIVKLADRLHNMRTLKYMTHEKQLQKANETLEIFAPLANRLGISTIKWELEDISLRYLKPQQYYKIVNLMKQKREEREAYIAQVVEDLKKYVKSVHIEAEISGRPKHIYSIYRKMVNQHKQFNEIYDLFAVRIIVESIKDCYAILGIIHTHWKPMPGRFKDYIAMPKANMYQSLHTTVIGPKGDPLEVQIRTQEMHDVAEYGIAAHWAYKEGKTRNINNKFEDKLTWFREILEYQNETDDAKEFMESLKMDLFSDTVFVFTPKGDVIELPVGSVPIDFAYRIHTEIGNKTVGARVNGKMVPLDYKLKTGDIVEVLTSKHSYGPSRDWLKIAKSSAVKNKIKQWFKRQQRQENVANGRDMIEKELRNQGLSIKDTLTEEKLAEVVKKFNFSHENELYAAVGYNGIPARQVVDRLTEDERKAKEEPVSPARQLPESKPAPRRKTSLGVKVKGVDNLLVRLARCCNPVPGDAIVGYITRGRGVTVHRKDCPNIKSEEEQRLISVEWENTESKAKEYNVDIEINAYDRNGLLNEVLQCVTDAHTAINGVSGRADKNKVATIHMTIAITNIDHLYRVVEKIKRIPDIYSVRRVMQ